MTQVTEKQVEAGVKKAREMLDAYSSFYSGMVSDDQLKSVIIEVANAILAA